jgi:hypothetical protein
MMTVLSYLERIPNWTYALIVAAVAARTSLQLLAREERKWLTDLVWGMVVSFALATRFSSVLLNPSQILHFNLFIILGSTAINGWLVGTAVMFLYTAVTLFRTRRLSAESLYHVTVMLLYGVAGAACYEFFTHLRPYTYQDLLVFIFTVLLLLWTRLRSSQLMHMPQRLWLGFGILWLTSSAIVPHFNLIWLFDSGQWAAIVLIALGIGAEALRDLKHSA